MEVRFRFLSPGSDRCSTNTFIGLVDVCFPSSRSTYSFFDVAIVETKHPFQKRS
jgi:hypothetical protein